MTTTDDHAAESATAPPTRVPDFEPVAVESRFPPPKAQIDPDSSLGWMRRLWPVVRSHRGPLITGLLGGLVAIALGVSVPAVARAAIDAVDNGDRSGLNVLVAVLLGLAVGRFVFGALYRYALFELAWEVETDLRSLLYAHLTTLSFSYYDRTQSGQVISRANSDIRSIQLFLAFAPLISMSVLTFLVAFVFMLTIHVPLTLVALATLPGVYVVGRKLRNTVFPLTWVAQARMAELATIVDENINGTRVVKSFAAEERQINTLAQTAEQLRWTNVEAIKARAKYNPVIEALPRVGMAMVLLYGGWLAIDGTVSVGTLFAFNAYVIMLQAPFRMFGFLILQAQRAAASAQRIFEVLDEHPEIVDNDDAKDLVVTSGRLRFENVSFGYRAGANNDEHDDNDDASSSAVLNGFSLVVEPGETVAIVGRTGSGKSTVARLLTRFYEATDGHITIDGQRTDEVTLASLRHHIGLVFDEPFLFSTSVRDNIAYGAPFASDEEIVRAATSAQAHQFIVELENGYDTVVGERGYTLSGGQRQRIAIARTLLENPPILVLDDATSAIDVTVESAIHAALHGLFDQRTTILIAHRLSTIALADRVVLLDGGRVVASGTHQELLATEPLYVQILAEADHTDLADQLDGGQSPDNGQAAGTGAGGDS